MGQPAMYETNVNLSTVLITTLASVASLIAIAIAIGALHFRWAPVSGVLAMATHSFVVRHSVICSQQREREAYEFGREVRSVR